jgi:hypothetical protein
MRCLVGVLGQGLVVKIMCRFWVKGAIELILAAEFKTGMGVFVKEYVPIPYN